jgi:hypothetical protein
MQQNMFPAKGTLSQMLDFTAQTSQHRCISQLCFVHSFSLKSFNDFSGDISRVHAWIKRITSCIMAFNKFKEAVICDAGSGPDHPFLGVGKGVSKILRRATSTK